MELSNDAAFNYTISDLTSSLMTLDWSLANGAVKTSNYNLDTSIASSNSINSHLQSIANSSVNINAGHLNASLPIHHPNCIDQLVHNASSCFTNSQLINDTQLLDEHVMPWTIYLLWSFIFGSIVFISTAGNCIVCWIILFHKQMRSVTNFHLCMYHFFFRLISN